MAALPEHPHVAQGLAQLERYRAECDVLSAALEQQDRAAVQGSAARLDALYEGIAAGYAPVALRLDMVKKMVEAYRHHAPEQARAALERALEVWGPTQERLAELPPEIAPQDDVRGGLVAMQQAFLDIVESLAQVHQNVQARDLSPQWARLHTGMRRAAGRAAAGAIGPGVESTACGSSTGRPLTGERNVVI